MITILTAQEEQRIKPHPFIKGAWLISDELTEQEKRFMIG